MHVEDVPVPVRGGMNVTIRACVVD
jgi:hypothetical protein